MGKPWTRDIVLLLALLVAATGIAGAFGYPGPGFAAGALAYLALSFRRLRRLQQWLAQGEFERVAPIHGGLLGDVGDQVYLLHKQLQRQIDEASGVIAHLHQSYSALKDGVIILDADDAIEWCNASAVDLLALRFPQDTGQPLINLVRNPEFADYMSSRRFERSLETGGPGIQARRLEIQATPFGTDHKILFVRDVTALKRLETVRRDFVANISHELRTPLTVIAGYVDTLQDLLPQDSPVIDRVLSQMQQQATRMENLLRDLLLLSKLESLDEAEIGEEETIAVCAMLESIRENAMASCAGERSIVLECDPKLGLFGRRIEIESIFSNLIFNAVKYTSSGGTIRVEFRREGDQALFCVSDDGIGIDPSHVPRLTERFYRVDSGRSVEQGGTGLGLSIVKHALKRMGADLRIESRPGAGSSFQCRFPASRLRGEPKAL
jgi:two-component system, OmpR family, phosphate regulon sensor histidine kinase PhoR